MNINIPPGNSVHGAQVAVSQSCFPVLISGVLWKINTCRFSVYQRCFFRVKAAFCVSSLIGPKTRLLLSMISEPEELFLCLPNARLGRNFEPRSTASAATHVGCGGIKRVRPRFCKKGNLCHSSLKDGTWSSILRRVQYIA